MEKALTYKDSGVNIHAGYEAVSRMKTHVARTITAGVLGGIGSFGGLFELPSGYRNPVLVSGTDGVGTKLKLAFMANRHDTVGIDCVAMCANDIVCQGAKPLFFLDYIGCGKLDPAQVEAIVAGVSEGCVQAGCALIGGETAEMPGFYPAGEYDLAGFCVGIVEKSALLKPENVRAGDALIGVSSSGIHSNGFSLVRKLFFEKLGCTPDHMFSELGRPLIDVLLTPTRIYVKTALSLLENFEIHGFAHITGGGLIENIPRMLPDQLGARVNLTVIDTPPIFSLIERLGNVPKTDMLNSFNMGVGLVAAVPAESADAVIGHLSALGEKAAVIGEVVPKQNGEGIRFD